MELHALNSHALSAHGCHGGASTNALQEYLVPLCHFPETLGRFGQIVGTPTISTSIVHGLNLSGAAVTPSDIRAI